MEEDLLNITMKTMEEVEVGREVVLGAEMGMVGGGRRRHCRCGGWRRDRVFNQTGPPSTPCFVRWKREACLRFVRLWNASRLFLGPLGRE